MDGMIGLRARLSAHRVRQRLLAQSDGLWLDRNVQVIDSTFERRNRVAQGCTVLNSHLGCYSYVGPGSIVAHAKVGRYSSIAAGVIIGSGRHPLDRVAMHPVFYLARPDMGWDYVSETNFVEFQPTTIGNDVWIGARAVIRDGVTVGDGAVIGAGSVVVKDVDPYAIVGGVPAKLIRYRFDSEDIASLLALRWWDKDEEWIRTNAVRLAETSTAQLAGKLLPQL